MKPIKESLDNGLGRHISPRDRFGLRHFEGGQTQRPDLQEAATKGNVGKAAIEKAKIRGFPQHRNSLSGTSCPYPQQALIHASDCHEIVLCGRNITELRDILERKASKFLEDAEALLTEMSYELVPAVDHAEKLIRTGGLFLGCRFPICGSSIL